YYEKENQTNFLLGFCFGTALLMLLVVLFLYISSRERHLIYYALHIVFMLLWQLSYYGFFAAYLWPEKPYLNFYGHYTCGSLAAIFQITFMLIYFQIKPPHNVYYVFNTLRWMFIAIVIPVAVLRISNHWLFQVPAFFYIALLFLYIATILYYLIIADKKLIEVRVLIAAASVVGALSMLRVFEVAGITNSSLLVSHSITIGQYFEMLIFTGGLAYSFAVYKKNYIKKIIEFNELQKAHYESTIQLIDDERNRIAADLHDMLGSQLAGIKLKTQLTYPHHESTAEIVTDLDDAYSQLRTLAKDLKTIDWDFYSVYETLEAKVQYLNSISSIQFQLTTPKPDERFLQTNAKRHLHAIASELLLNVLKHAQATHCMISLTNPSEGNIQLDIRDNGRDAVIDFQKGIGLTNIQERINGLGGEFSFRSEDAGFTVSVML
nr:7TM diverse intracellular signaling domain-containing protein [Chitinophagaceae bacterium]